MAPQSARPVGAIYYPVSPRKFAVLSILTWGVYEIYWFYKNWQFIQERDNSAIWPWARALWAPFWYPALIRDLRESRRASPITPVFAPSAAYFLLVISWRLPEPFWLVSLLTFVPLLPLVHQIIALNGEESVQYVHNSAWKLRHGFLALFSAPLLAFTVVSSIALIPSTLITPGWMVWGPSRSFLEDAAVIEPGEEILYFYSAGLFSFEESGNLLTDRRVIWYWTDQETGELFVDSARFSEIANTEVQNGNWIDDTVLTVIRHDGSGIELFLPTGEGGDELFLSRLETLMRE